MISRRRPAGGYHSGPFFALVQAMAAITQEDPDRFRAAVRAVDPDRLVRMAARHRCSAMLLRGMTAFAADPDGRVLAKGLRAAVKAGALRTFTTRPQIDTLLVTLARAGIPCVLLKGAARLYTREPDADWEPIADLDVLIRPEDADGAVAALHALGYRVAGGAREAAWYRAHHHHLAPLTPPGKGVPVELHVALAPLSISSLWLDWKALAAYRQDVNGTAGPTLCLNATGTALHRAIHAIGLTRLHDVVLLARSLRQGDRQMAEELRRISQAERRNEIALKAALTLAASIAGLEWQSTEAVRRYVAWTSRREELPVYIGSRVQLVDAWFANGGRLLGPATRLALPHLPEGGRPSTITDIVRWPLQLAGRVLIGGYGVLLATRLPSFRPR